MRYIFNSYKESELLKKVFIITLILIVITTTISIKGLAYMKELEYTDETGSEYSSIEEDIYEVNEIVEDSIDEEESSDVDKPKEINQEELTSLNNAEVTNESETSVAHSFDHSNATPLTQTSGTLPAGDYYLENNITLTADLTISGTTNICLNGKTINAINSNGIPIRINNDVTLNIYDCSASGSGTIDNCCFDVNSGTLNIYGGSVTGRPIETLGTIYIRNHGNVYLGECIISGNTALKGIYCNNSELIIDGATIRNNGHTATYGGGIFATASSNIEIRSGTISNNRGRDGGGIYAVGGTTVTIKTGTQIIANTMQTGGGGIYLSGENTTLNMQGGSISSNVWQSSTNTETKGGGICIESSATANISGGTITSNMAYLGAGIYNYGGTLNVSGNDTLISTNGYYTTSSSSAKTEAKGGGIYAKGAEEELDDNGEVIVEGVTTNVSITGGSIYDNRSYMGAGAYLESVTVTADITASFTYNKVFTKGGGLYILGSSANVVNSTFDNNRANGGSTGTDGAAIYAKGASIDTQINITNCVATNNYVQMSSNAAVCAVYPGTINISGGTIDNNECVGIYSAYSGTTARITISDVTVTNNKATGIISTCGTPNNSYRTTISNCLIKGNSSNNVSYGAGIGLTYGCIIRDCIIEDNEAYTGGGLWINGGTVTITGTTFSNNRAKLSGSSTTYGSGGAIYVYSSAGLSITSSEIKNNTAERHGGGIYYKTLGSALTLNSTEISGNSAAEYGGGICAIRQGSSGYGYVSTDRYSEIKNNTARDGGGLAALDGTQIYISCSVTGNTATRYGGGIYTGNTTSYDTYAAFIQVGANGIITENEAGEDGGGIRISDPYELRLRENCTINENTLENGQTSNASLQDQKVSVVYRLYANSQNANVGITSYRSDAFTTGYSTYEGSTAPSTYFFADDSTNQTVSWTDDNREAKLTSQKYRIYYYFYDTASASSPQDTTLYSSGQTATIQFTPHPQFAGKEFLGWDTDPLATTPTYTATGTNTIQLTDSNVILYPIYRTLQMSATVPVSMTVEISSAGEVTFPSGNINCIKNTGDDIVLSYIYYYWLKDTSNDYLFTDPKKLRIYLNTNEATLGGSTSGSVSINRTIEKNETYQLNYTMSIGSGNYLTHIPTSEDIIGRLIYTVRIKEEWEKD